MNRLLVAAALLLPAVATTATAQQPATPVEAPRQKILVHITHGPEHPTRAALGFHVAHAALEQGHEVTLFLAGDAVQLMRTGVIDNLAGLGTGDLRKLYDGIVARGGRFYLSGGSSQARGLAEAELTAPGAQFGSPGDLVRLALEHDRMFTY